VLADKKAQAAKKVAAAKAAAAKKAAAVKATAVKKALAVKKAAAAKKEAIKRAAEAKKAAAAKKVAADKAAAERAVIAEAKRLEAVQRRAAQEAARAEAREQKARERAEAKLRKEQERTYKNPYIDDERFVEGVSEDLVAHRGELDRQVEQLLKEAEALVQERDTSVGWDEDAGDGLGGDIEHELDVMQAERLRLELEEIDAAFARMRSRSFGMCESCHKPIGRERLRAMPHKSLCIDCAKGGLGVRR
jgi:DnaK suppressor protein